MCARRQFGAACVSGVGAIDRMGTSLERLRQGASRITRAACIEGAAQFPISAFGFELIAGRFPYELYT